MSDLAEAICVSGTREACLELRATVLDMSDGVRTMSCVCLGGVRNAFRLDIQHPHHRDLHGTMSVAMAYEHPTYI